MLTSPPPAGRLAFILPDAAYCELALELDRTLPAPATPEERTSRDYTAIAEIAALQPANSKEVRLACSSVITSEYANRCLQQSGRPSDPARRGAQMPRPGSQQSGIARGRRSERVNPALDDISASGRQRHPSAPPPSGQPQANRDQPSGLRPRRPPRAHHRRRHDPGARKSASLI